MEPTSKTVLSSQEPSYLALVTAGVLLGTMTMCIIVNVKWALAGIATSLVLLHVFHWASVPRRPRKHEPWWAWHWDETEVFNAPITYDRIVRWRRGSFATLYRFDGPRSTEWRLYLPFNASVGIHVDKENDR